MGSVQSIVPRHSHLEQRWRKVRKISAREWLGLKAQKAGVMIQSAEKACPKITGEGIDVIASRK